MSSRILGLNRTQDASACWLCAERVISLQKERITRTKHHWGRLGDLARYAERLPLAGGVDLVVECYSSDAEASLRAEYRAELTATLGACEVVEISHHLAHLYGAYFPSGFEQAAVMIIDCQGSPLRALTEAWSAPASAGPEDLEVGSFYHCHGRDIRCIGKQLWDGDHQLPVGLGMFYLLLTAAIFPGHAGQEGKVMGLASFGDPDALDLPGLPVEGGDVYLTPEWLRVFLDRETFRYGAEPRQFQRAADLAAAGQQVFEQALLTVARWLHGETRASRLCFSGGIALNCVANGRLLREGPFTELFVPPAPHDGGTALGCALFGAIAVRGEEPRFRWTHDYLGPEPAMPSRASLEAHPQLVIEAPADLADRAAEALASGRVVATFFGPSESGPRALGHRSFLADARSPHVCDWINARVKGRERFRPLAPMVLAERAGEIFDLAAPAPFMQLACDVRPAWRRRLPAITHVDGSARIQTVAAQDDPLVRAMLEAFARRTGTPVLVNTSLNGPGEPLVETFEEALDLFLRTPIHGLVVPPFFVSKRQEPALPAPLADAGKAPWDRP